MRITKEYTIWCERCCKWHQESWTKNKTMFAKMMKKAGWKDRKGMTLCPDCAAKEPRPKDHEI